MGIVISSFTDKYKEFSNFYPAIINFQGLNFPTVEHAYQASKSKEFFWWRIMSNLPAEKAGLAKSRGQLGRLPKDWEDKKIEIMHGLLCQKFNQEPLKTKLLKTEDAILIEGNYWHDNIWGDCYCKKCKDIEGQNWMGRLLMDIRSQIDEKDNCYRRYS